MTCILKCFKVLIYLLFLLILISPASSQPNHSKLELKITGGLSYLVVGGLNYHTTDWNKSRRLSVEANGGNILSENEELHWGSEISAELLYYVHPRVALSIGSGYIMGTINDTAKTNTNDVIAYVTNDLNVQAIPITIGGYFNFPFSSKTQIILNAGVGYYYANFEKLYTRAPGNGNVIDNEFTGKSDGIGLNGGIGIKHFLSKRISIFLETQGRYAKISGATGSRVRNESNDWGDSVDGTYYEFEREREEGIWSRIFNIYTEKPTGDNIRKVENGALDFSGYNIKVGLSFGLF